MSIFCNVLQLDVLHFTSHHFTTGPALQMLYRGIVSCRMWVLSSQPKAVRLRQNCPLRRKLARWGVCTDDLSVWITPRYDMIWPQIASQVVASKLIRQCDSCTVHGLSHEERHKIDHVPPRRFATLCIDTVIPDAFWHFLTLQLYVSISIGTWRVRSVFSHRVTEAQSIPSPSTTCHVLRALRVITFSRFSNTTVRGRKTECLRMRNLNAVKDSQRHSKLWKSSPMRFLISLINSKYHSRSASVKTVPISLNPESLEYYSWLAWLGDLVQQGRRFPVATVLRPMRRFQALRPKTAAFTVDSR